MEEFLVFRGGVQGNENSNSPRWAHWSFFFFFSRTRGSLHVWLLEGLWSDHNKDTCYIILDLPRLFDIYIIYIIYILMATEDCTSFTFSKYPLQILGACSNVRVQRVATIRQKWEPIRKFQERKKESNKSN